jgi:2-amino-4-hydroxy-6-hydroxymethyldihydropteridine diphosphokinase
MSWAFIALGSNVDPEAHLRQAAHLLRRRFSSARFSACYRSAAYGFSGEDFINAAAGIASELPVGALLLELRAIERQCGRGAADARWGPRAIDLDLLLYADQVGGGEGYTLPRPDLTARAYMLGPLAEIASQQRYPPHGPTIGELWASFPEPRGLTRIGLDLGAD